MSLELWLAFVAASTVVLIIPGPTILLVISYALSHGRRATGAVVAGVALSDFTAMTASMLGLGALLTASAGAFTILKWMGALYLIYLGIALWRAPVAEPSADTPAVSSRQTGRTFAHAYAVTTLNPKSIVFFVAFLPQFVDPTQPILLQIVIFETTFLGLATLNATGYGLLATLARRSIRNPAVQRAVNRTGGACMVSAGLLTVAWRRATP